MFATARRALRWFADRQGGVHAARISKSLLRNELLKHQLTVVRIGRRLFVPNRPATTWFVGGCDPSPVCQGEGTMRISVEAAPSDPRSVGAAAAAI